MLSPGSGVGITCPWAGSLCEISPVRYLASLSISTSSSVTKEGIHRPCRSEPDIIEGPKRLNLEVWCWNSPSMEGEPQSAEEVVEENYPLVRFRGRDDLARGWQLVRDIRG